MPRHHFSYQSYAVTRKRTGQRLRFYLAQAIAQAFNYRADRAQQYMGLRRLFYRSIDGFC